MNKDQLKKFANLLGKNNLQLVLEILDTKETLEKTIKNIDILISEIPNVVKKEIEKNLPILGIDFYTEDEIDIISKDIYKNLLEQLPKESELEKKLTEKLKAAIRPVEKTVETIIEKTQIVKEVPVETIVKTITEQKEQTPEQILTKLESLPEEQRPWYSIFQTLINKFVDLEKRIEARMPEIAHRVGSGLRGFFLFINGSDVGQTQFLDIRGDGVSFERDGQIAKVTIAGTGGASGVDNTITISGTIDDSNVTFTSAIEPIELVINGLAYKPTGGAITWSYSAGTITLSSAVGTGGSIYGRVGSNLDKCVVSVLINDDLALTTGDGKAYWRVPNEIDGWILTEVYAARASGGTGVPSIQVNNATAAVDMLSTNVTIDSGETDSSTATTPVVINTSNDEVGGGDRLRFDCDVAGTGTLWAEVQLVFERP